MTERIYLQLFHSDTPGAVPPDGLLIGEIGLNVHDNLEFIGYGGDINYDIGGNPLPDLPPVGKGWKTYGIGGDGPPGPPGPAGDGVPEGGTTGQYLRKSGDGDFVTEWNDGPPSADHNVEGLVYGKTDGFFAGENTSLGWGSLATLQTGERNVAVGFQSGLNVDPSYDNVFIGYQAGYNIDGNENVIIGSEACGNNPGGGATGNVILGFEAAQNATSANYNVLIGRKAGYNIRGGDNNTIIGSYYGSADLQGNVVLADGQGNIRFQANESGAWAATGSYGTEGQVLTSHGASAPPTWETQEQEEGVTQLIAGTAITLDPPDGKGIVTVSFDGDPDAGVQALTKGPGIQFLENGVQVSTITSAGTIQIDSSVVITTQSFLGNGSILYRSPSGVTSLAPGSAGQALIISTSNLPAWEDIPLPEMAQPDTAGIVFGLTDAGPTQNVALGLGAGSAITGSAQKNTFIGTGAGNQVNTGDANVILGAYGGNSDLSNNIVLSDGDGTIRLQINEDGALSVDGTDYGQAGYVLSSTGANTPPQWIDPPNAPIQDIEAGTGIDVAAVGTTVTVTNTGVTSLVATAPLQVSDDTGAITISAPNVLSDLQAGTGITLSGAGNTRTISNAGMLSMVDGANTVVTQVTPGVWKVDAAGGPESIVELAEGAGINITDPTGPVPTIYNDGVISVAASANVIPSATKGAGITFSLANVVFGVTAGEGISIGGTAENPVITNTGVTKITGGANISVSGTTGTGDLTISATGLFTGVTAGAGITVTPDGATSTIANAGVIQLVDGTGTTAVNNGNGTWQINATGTAGVTQIVAGENVSISPVGGTGVVTISAVGGGGSGSIEEIQSANAGITVTSGTGPITTLTNNGVLELTAGSNVTITGTNANKTISAISPISSVTAGTGIAVTNGTGGGATEISNTGVLSVTGTADRITVGGTAANPVLDVGSSVLTDLTAGTGIAVSGTGNTRQIVNSGVTSLTAGAGISLSGGTGNVTITATGGGGGGDITEIKAGDAYIGVAQGTGPIVTLTSLGVNTITAGTGILKTGTATAPTLALDTSTVPTFSSYLSGNGISITGTGNTRTIANSGVVSLVNGTGITATQGSNGAWTLNNTGVTKIVAGTNVTISPTTGTGTVTINATGGGGGGGTVTSISAGYGLNGGTITSSGTLSINDDICVTYDQYKSKGGGNILYTDSTGVDWTGNIPVLASVVSKAVLQGWAVGPGTYVSWGYPDVGGFQDSSSVTYHKALVPILTPNEYYFDVNTSWVDASWVRRDLYSTVGSILYSDVAGSPATLNAGANGTVLTIVNGKPAWTANPGKTYTVTAPITLTGTNNTVIGFDVATTALTSYIPKSAFSAAATLLVGSGVGTYATLNPGSNGQFLTVNSSGALAWANIPTPPEISLTPGDATITMDPNPITGTGTIKVTPGTFIEKTVIQNAGDMIYGATTSPYAPSRLSIGNPGDVLIVSGTRPIWSNAIDGGSY